MLPQMLLAVPEYDHLFSFHLTQNSRPTREIGKSRLDLKNSTKYFMCYTSVYALSMISTCRSKLLVTLCTYVKSFFVLLISCTYVHS